MKNRTFKNQTQNNSTTPNPTNLTSVDEVLVIDIVSFSKESYEKITSVMTIPAVMTRVEYQAKIRQLIKFRGEVPEFNRIETQSFRYVSLIGKK